MHPRPASAPPRNAESQGHEGSRLEVTLRCGSQRTRLRIDLAARRVALERI